MKFDVSVILLNYNPDYNKLCATLKSVLSQKDVRFEIIIADDYSKVTFEKEMKEIFKGYGFDSYKFVLHGENVGTVRNLYDAVNVAEGKYVKPISPADCLYDEKTLYTVFSYMESNHSKLLFGDMVYYQQGESIDVFHIKTPWVEKIYRWDKYNAKKVLKHQMIYYENISGAAVFYEKCLMLEGLEFILGTVRYAEDAMLQYFVTKGEKISYLHQYILWYEYGLGISTSMETGGSPKLLKDFHAFYNLLSSQYPKNKIVRRNTVIWNLVYDNKKYKKLFLKMLGLDYVLFYMKRLLIKRKYRCEGYNTTYIDHWFND